MDRPGILLFSLVLLLEIGMDVWTLRTLRALPPALQPALKNGGKWQRLLRPLDALVWVALFEIALTFPPEGLGIALFQGVSAVSVLLLFRWAWSPALRQAGAFGTLVFWSRGMFQIPAILTLYGIWTFIDGAGFFANIVLPFSTSGLRFLCETARWAFVGLGVLQAIYWAILRREKSVQPSIPIASTGQASKAS